MNIKPIVTITALLLFFGAPAGAAPSTPTKDVKQEIISRCKSQMGEYGAMMVKACVDQDIDAVKALNTYPKQHAAIVDRCMNQMRTYGYTMVKACVDQDVEAEKALSLY